MYDELDTKKTLGEKGDRLVSVSATIKPTPLFRCKLVLAPINRTFYLLMVMIHDSLIP